jgi:hypothetical protein
MVTRYEIIYIYNGEVEWRKKVCDDGNFVLYDDHAVEVARLEKERDEFKAQLEDLAYKAQINE